jgi:hypothetical protein
MERMSRYLLLSAGLALAACGDGLGPGAWDDRPDTTMIYSASRPEYLGRPSAYDFVGLRRVAIEGSTETGAWDVMLLDANGSLALLPAGALPGITSRAGIARVQATTLAEVREAPRDTAAFVTTGTVLEPGAIYVVRSRREICFGFGSGVRYAKIQVVALDPAAGTFRFAVVRNPICNNRSLVPPDR